MKCPSCQHENRPNAKFCEECAAPFSGIWGMKDTASLVGSLIGLDKWATNLKVKLYPEGTHWVMVAQPQQVAQDMRNFFTDDKTFPKESVYRGK